MIASDVKLHPYTKVMQPSLVNLYGCEIGEHTKIAAYVEVQRGVKIGDRCKVEAFTFICSGVTIENEVFIGPHVCFTNDKHPRAVNVDGQLLGPGEWEITPTLVESGASIGAGSVILCGVTIGAGAIIGAGSVVTHDVKPGETWRGEPARVRARG